MKKLSLRLKQRIGNAVLDLWALKRANPEITNVQFVVAVEGCILECERNSELSVEESGQNIKLSHSEGPDYRLIDRDGVTRRVVRI